MQNSSGLGAKLRWNRILLDWNRGLWVIKAREELLEDPRFGVSILGRAEWFWLWGRILQVEFLSRCFYIAVLTGTVLPCPLLYFLPLSANTKNLCRGLQYEFRFGEPSIRNKVFDLIVFVVVLTFASVHFQISIFRSAGDSARGGKIVLTINIKFWTEVKQ